MTTFFTTTLFPNARTSSGWPGWRALQPLRPACSRTTTFLWLVVVLAALCLRPDLAGVTSLVRSLGLSDASYYCLLHFFHSPALDLDRLTRLWRQTLQRIVPPLPGAGQRAVRWCWSMASSGPRKAEKCRGSKACTRSPAATPRLPSSWATPSRPSPCWCRWPGFTWPCRWPLASTRAWSGAIATGAPCWINSALCCSDCSGSGPLTVVADAYYAAAKFARSLAWPRATTWSRACAPTPSPISRPRHVPQAAPRTTRRLWTQNPAPGLVSLPPTVSQGPQSGLWRVGHYPALLHHDLLWRPLGSLVRFVWVIHPTRGNLVLLCTDLTLDGAGDHSPLRLALQNRSQFQAGHSHRRRLRLSLLDAGHESHPPRQRLAISASQVRGLPGARPPQVGGLRAAHPVGPHRPGIAPIPGAEFPARRLVQFPLLHPHRLAAKTTFRMGRVARAPPHLAGFSRWFTRKAPPSRNSWPPKSARPAAAMLTALDLDNAA